MYIYIAIYSYILLFIRTHIYYSNVPIVIDNAFDNLSASDRLTHGVVTDFVELLVERLC